MQLRPTCSRIRFAASLLIAALFALPLWVVLVTSLDDPAGLGFSTWLIPSRLRFENYVEAWHATNFPRQFVNSLVVALAVTAGQVLTSLMAGYAFARIRFIGRDVILMALLSTIIVPFQVLVIPVFVILAKLSWINTYWALIVPSLANAFGIFLFAQFFRTIPYELEEAAYVDGATRWRVLWQIMVPLARPAIATLFLFTFIAEWNELFKPLVFTSTKDMRTVQLGLSVFQEQFRVDYVHLMAAVVFTTVPSVLLFLLGQKHFVKGIATTGLK
ncbi:MAG: carbohydrate ABC transporter permease [Acidobacteria bacterium]|nr:carbohydrate ABC transporter permease [Acidobacteriota bacterium]